MYGQKQLSIREFIKTPVNYQELIRGFFDLNYREFIVLCTLNQLGEADTEEIGDETDNGWPRNKLNSALRKLVNIGLATREKTIPEDQKRGFKYVYKCVDPNQIKEQILVTFDEFMIEARNELNDLEFHFKSVDTKAYRRKKEKRDKIKEEWFDENE